MRKSVNEELRHILIAQTEILLKNVEDTIEAVRDSQLSDGEICEWTPGKQLYHLLRSMDQWFINPNGFEEPAGKGRRLAGLDAPKKTKLSKAELTEYCETIKAKILSYLEKLDLGTLEDPAGSKNSSEA